jgi:hypothetical protein
MFQIASEEQQGDFQGPWRKRNNKSKIGKTLK